MPSEAARRNHDRLFPGRVSVLGSTDPELIEYFDNFAFGEVPAHDGLDERTRLMVQLAAMIACQAISEYRVMLGAALTAGITPVQVKEIVYQAVPYAGMAKVFDFLLEMTDTTAIRQLTDRCWRQLGRIDVVVSNAGYGLFGAAEELSDAQVAALAREELLPLPQSR